MDNTQPSSILKVAMSMILGDYYLNQKDIVNAINSFNKVLAIAPAPHSKKKLESLQKAVSK